MHPPAYRIEGRDGAVFVEIHVVPGSKREGVVGIHGDALKIAVRARPEKGKANASLVAALSRVVGVRRSAVEIVSGHSSRRKRVRIDGPTADEVRARIDAALRATPGRPALP